MNTLLATSFASIMLVSASLNAGAQSHPSSTSVPNSPMDQSAGLSPDHTWWDNRHIEGVWEEQVAQINCADGTVLRAFSALNSFASGGTLTAYNSTPPSLSGVALGTWWRTSWNGDFGAKMKFLRYNPDGSFAGSQEVSRTIRLDPYGETLTGEITFQVFDVNDHLVMGGCARETGMRFR